MHNFDFLKVVLVFDAAFGPPACCDHNSLKPNLEFFYQIDDKAVFLKGPSFRKLGCIRVFGVQGIEADIEDVIFGLEGDQISGQLAYTSNSKDIFHDIIITMLSDNEFLSPQEQTLRHLKCIIYQRRSPHEHLVQQFAEDSLAKVVYLIERGLCAVSAKSSKIEELISKEEVTEAELQKQERKRKMELRQMKNSLLYGKNKNKQTLGQQFQQFGLFSNTQHIKFIQEMKKDNSLRKFNREKLKQSEQAEKEAALNSERQQTEAARIMEIERRKQAIKQSLKIMRENHLFLLQQQQESKKNFNKVSRKKRLYERMKQSYEGIASEMLSQKEQRAMKERQRLNKLNLQQILSHQKEYEQWKKKQSSQHSRVKQNLNADLPHFYQPPAHSQKISQFLSDQVKNKNKIQIGRRLATEKLHRVAQYTTKVRQKFKPKSPPASKVENIKKGKSLGILEGDNKKSHNQLGNEYLKQAKLIIRKRAKTEQRSLNPQTVNSSHSKHQKEKSRTVTLNYIPQRKKREYIERMKREQIENILKGGYQNQSQRLQRLKMADERLSRELHKKQNEMKVRYSAESSQNTLALLLGTIKAKISLIDYYNTSK